MILDLLIGQTLIDVERIGNGGLKFLLPDGTLYRLYHDCCDTVLFEDVVGEISNLVGTPLLVAEKITSVDREHSSTLTLTFYNFATAKGRVTVHWGIRSSGDDSDEEDWVVN